MPDHERRRIPAHTVDRPALRARLDAGLLSPLSLIVAPAGAGKTVLLSQWAHARTDLPIAWLDITDADVDANALRQRLIDAITAIAPGFDAPISPAAAAEGRLGEPLLEELAAGLADAGPVVVIFDDLDRLGGGPLLTDLWRLVDLLPPGAHFVFSARRDLRLGWSRHRLQHSLVEIRQRDLAFDDPTTARVIEAITRRPVPIETAASVTEHTEGWAVGVQLAALSLRFTTDPRRLIDTLADTDRLVVDYLSEEVLDAQGADRRTSLFRIAVLDEFCAPLVDAVLGTGGAELIADLELDSMFVVPVPGKPGWYRFHQLFRNLLLLRLRAYDAPAEARVLIAAADWNRADGSQAEAIEYYLRAHAWESAVDCVLTLERDDDERRQTAAIAAWLSRVPSEVLTHRTEAELLLTIAQGLSGQGTVAIDALRAMLAERALTTGERQVALTYLSSCVYLAPHPELFVDAAQRALDLLRRHPEAALPNLLGLTSRGTLRLVARVSLGRALLLLGDLAGSRRALRDALQGDGVAYGPYRVQAMGSLALTEALSGRLVVAAELADDALRVAEELGVLEHTAPADAYLARAIAAIRRGEPDHGAFALAEGTTRAASNDRSQLLWLAHLTSMIIDTPDSAIGPPEPSSPAPPFVRQVAAALSLRQARLRGAPALPPTPAAHWSMMAFEEVAALLALGQPAQARARLAELDMTERTLAPMPTIERDLLLGWACAIEGRGAQSRTHLQSALTLAAPERLVYPFLEAGPDVAHLIAELPGPLDGFRQLVVSRGRARGMSRRRQPLADSLTARELELLAYLPTRMTCAEIAARSFVSINTIKTHLGHIYRKLGVTGRDAAIERAVDLGLLDPSEVAPVG